MTVPGYAAVPHGRRCRSVLAASDDGYMRLLLPKQAYSATTDGGHGAGTLTGASARRHASHGLTSLLGCTILSEVSP